ncbi:MAG: hypothetical protein GXO15_00055 [Crenarchaeota archaeon]|nr:hypothetical protein [Thermoproteota archaeon]
MMGGLYAALEGLAWASYKRSVRELSDEELLELLGVLNVRGAMAEWVVRRLRCGEKLGG